MASQLLCCTERPAKLEKPVTGSSMILISIVVLTSLYRTGVCELLAIEPYGYVNIDCGGKGGYNDSLTGLAWVGDEDYFESLTKGHQILTFSRKVVMNDSNPAFWNNAQQLETARNFIFGNSSQNGISKYCYRFNLSLSNIISTTYLVRAMFPPLLDIYHEGFYLAVDTTLLSVNQNDDEPVTIELLATSLDDSMDICLIAKYVYDSYYASLSSLEVRSVPNFGHGKLDYSGKPFSHTVNYYVTYSRLNFGGNESSPAVRYPSDKYDRLWYAAPRDSISWSVGQPMIGAKTDPRSDFKVISMNDSSVFRSSADDWPQPPPAVCASAWEAVNLSSNISFSLDISSPWYYETNMYSVYSLSIVLCDVNATMDGTRSVDMFNRDEDVASQWLFQDIAVPIARKQPYIWSEQRFKFFAETTTFEISRNAKSTRPAMINSLELYRVIENVPPKTDSNDVSGLRMLLDSITNSDQNLIDSFGDPCLPVAWRWVTCEKNADLQLHYVTEIHLGSQGLQGKLTEALEYPFFFEVLDLSNNSFHGTLPSTFQYSLKNIDLSDNNFTGSFPEFEVEYDLEMLDFLNLSSNSMSGNLERFSRNLTGLRVLDLSHNSFVGPIPAFPNRSMEVLNMSSNHLSGSINLFSNPDLVGDLPISGLISNESGIQPLRALRLENNNFSGIIPDDIWSSESQLEMVDLSNNNFTELDLTSWTQYLLALKIDNSSGRPQVNLVNNKIRSVIFGGNDADLVSKSDEDMYRLLRRTPGYILLGKNNEWCSSSKLSRARVLKAYLCRDIDSGDDYYFNLPQKDASSKRALIISLGVSISMFLVIACILLVILRRTRKRMEVLRQIQDELAKEDARPPFYKYDELRAATKYFSKDNELGSGGFGAVYKAELADKSIVAVKLLYPMEQNLTDFLKETVLITGIKHKHLVQLKGCCVRDKKRILVYEFAENGNLAQALWGNGVSIFLSWGQRLKICVGVAKGLAYLHEELQPKIIHRDIKPYNILLDKDWNAKIADFGLARYLEGDAGTIATVIAGTKGYLSPEYSNGLITEKLDVYSYGILLLEIVSGRKCIEHSAPNEEYYLRDWAFKLYRESDGCLLNMVEEALLESSPPAGEIEAVIKIALSCLQESYENRPCMSEVVTMITGNVSGVAIDIVEELRERQSALYTTIFDTSNGSTVSGTHDHESEDEVLLESSPTTKFYSADAWIELSVPNYGK